MALFSGDKSSEPMPEAIRPLARAASLAALGFGISFALLFTLFKNGTISGRLFLVLTVTIIGAFTLITQSLRRTARKRGTSLTAEQKDILNLDSLYKFRRQRQSNTILLCIFCFGGVMVLLNVILNRQGVPLLLIPIALIAFGLLMRRSTNRIIRTLEDKVESSHQGTGTP